MKFKWESEKKAHNQQTQTLNQPWCLAHCLPNELTWPSNTTVQSAREQSKMGANNKAVLIYW